MLCRGLGGQYVAALRGHALEDLCHLVRGLALGKNHLRHPGSDAPVMVDLGEAHVLKRHVAQAGHGIVRRDRAFADVLQQLAESDGIHGVQKSRP